MKVLVSAYACEPEKGSEPEVGWQMAVGLAERGHEVWVITRVNNRTGIEKSLAQLNLPNLHFSYFDLPAWILWLKRHIGVNAYYRLWQCGALRLARRLHAQVAFDRGQHVTFVSIRHPTFLRHLGIPYVFGPVAGGEHAPRGMLAGLPWRFRCGEALRMGMTRLSMLSPGVRATLKRAARVVVTSPQTGSLLPVEVLQTAEVRLAITAPPPLSGSPLTRRQTGQPMRALSVGRALHWKGMHLGLQALALARARGAGVTLTLLSEGPARPWLERHANQLGLDGCVTFQNFVPRQELPSIYAQHDVLLFPSLRDSGGMVVLEAMQHGLPVVCLDLAGAGELVDEHCGMAIPAVHPDDACELMARALVRLAASPSLYAACSAAAAHRVKDFTLSGLLDSLGY